MLESFVTNTDFEATVPTPGFFYATTKGQYPLTTEKKWFECIVDAKELLNKVVTRKESTETKNTTKNLLENHQTTPSKKKKAVITG